MTISGRCRVTPINYQLYSFRFNHAGIYFASLVVYYRIQVIRDLCSVDEEKDTRATNFTKFSHSA